MNRRAFNLITLLAVAAPMAVAQSARPDSLVKTVGHLYAAGRYQDAEVEGRRLLEDPTVSDSVRVEVEQWIAFSLVAQGRTAMAEEHFLALLRIRPEYDLDPVLTSPKILSVFRSARMRVPATAAPRDTVAPTIVPIASITYRAFAFPGWEQLHDGRTTSGTVFMTAGIASLGTGIVLEFVRASARTRYLDATVPAEITSRYDTYNRAYRAEIAAFAAFGVVYLASQFDVLMSDGEPALSATLEPHRPVVLTFRFPL